MAQDARIDQFRKMTEADPDNELGHFSLGRAYLDAGMNPEAAASLERAIQINPNLSRAYHLLGTALLRQGLRDPAIARLSQGVHVADQRGELASKNEMIRLLQDLGAPVPHLQRPAETRAPTENEVLCARCSRLGSKLPKPPFRNPQGELIYQKVCAACWKEWIAMGTKVINELRLPLNDPQAQRVYDHHMMEFLNLPHGG